jgi:sugar phosphate isomerase/epimerase
VKLGCQTITFGENQRERFDEVFAAVAAGGFSGVEIGFRHIRPIAPAKLDELLRRHDLVLLASHVGGNLFDAGGASQERSLIEQVLDYLSQTRTALLMYSGLRFNNAEQFANDLASLNRAADACAKRGVRLLYHNHDWEFADGGRVMNALLAGASPNLGLCPDLGWIMKGGGDVLEFLARIHQRLGAIHFKDFATRAPASAGIDTCLLGQGVAPLREAGKWLRQNTPDVWVIAEQDQANVPAEQAVGANGRFLASIFSE